MTRTLEVLSAGPGAAVQDLGREGLLGMGVSRGGAMDRLALYEGAALLGQPAIRAAVELPGAGARFRVAGGPVRFAVTGAEMGVTVDGATVPHATTADAPSGAVIDITGARRGVYGYLHVDGGIATPEALGARATHLASGLGQSLAPGLSLPLGAPKRGEAGLTLDPEPRLGGGLLRIVPSYQTALFDPADQVRLAKTVLRRSNQGNRMGVRLDGGQFAAKGALQVLSDIIVPGDVQMTGDGAPFVLMADCQTTGGYPRIGSVLPCDLPRVAQAGPGDELRFAWVSPAEAVAAELAAATHRARLGTQVRPRLRSPHDIADLLRYQLIDGAITGWEEEVSP